LEGLFLYNKFLYEIKRETEKRKYIINLIKIISLY